MEANTDLTGKLYLVATPIGNLEDITLRALKCLKSVDIIACEDTRHSRILLEHYGIKARTTSYHEFNKFDRADELVMQMKKGVNVAVITDAGTPGISDPGEELVRKAVEAGVEITSLPGPSAVITALSMCGLSSRRFVFEGFLSTEKKERREAFDRLRNETRTMVIYEAPHRLKRTLGELEQVLGSRKICICRELTKKYEEIMRFSLKEAVDHFEQNDPRGEMVIIIEGLSEEEKKSMDASQWDAVSLKEHLERYTAKGMNEKDAMKAVAKDRGISKRDVYEQLKIHGE